MVATIALALAAAAAPAGAVPAARSSTTAPSSPAYFLPPTERALDQIVQTAMVASGTPGMAYGVWIPGRGTRVRAFGTDNVTTGEPFRVDDHVRIASITKTFTATAVLQLVDRRQIRLSDTLSIWFKGIPNADRITVRQMLAMKSGIYSFTDDAAFTKAYDENPRMAFGIENVLRIIKRNMPSFAPGSQLQYSDSNYFLLGEIVERVTHRTLGAVIRDQILEPLGMMHTVYPHTPEMPRPFSHGYFEGDGGQLRDVTFTNPDVPGGAGAMISTLGDLHIWAKALATGTLLKPATQRQRLQFTQFPGQVLDLGYGLGILNLNGFHGHDGAIYGYGTAMFYLPQKDATIVVEGNNNSNFSTVPLFVFLGLARYLFPGRFPQAQQLTSYR